MFSSLKPGKHSLLARSRARSRARSNEFDRNPQNPKRPIMILLRTLTGKSLGMIFLQDTLIRSGTRKREIRHNSIKICTLKEKHAQGMVGAKRLTMILLQDAKNNRPGMILLQKKVGGEGVTAHFSCQTAPRGASRYGTQAVCSTPQLDGTARLI